MIEQPKSSGTGFTFQIKNPGSTRNSVPNNMVAMKRIQNYSYALNDQIGLGFTSHVYRGKDELANKQVAVKVIQLKNHQQHAHFLQDEVAVLEMIKNADSTNLLRLQKVIKSKNNLYIITEFCEGNDVAKILRKKKILGEVEAQSIMKQMLNGYKQFYNLRLVHRDLKLANLFITKGQVKIADFGFAISQQQCNTVFEYNVGSPYYMPPESLKQNRYSFQSDVWAIGVIAYQLVYGKVPWKDRDDAVLYDMVMSCPVDRLFEADKQVTDHYKQFIKACLVNDKRFRATPDFIINYSWPLARDHVEGLDDPNQFRQSISKGSYPRMSIEKPSLKKISSQNTDQQFNEARRKTLDSGSFKNIIKQQERTPTFPPRHNPAVVQSFVQQPVIYRQSEFSRERKSVSRQKIRPRSRSLSREGSRKIVRQLSIQRLRPQQNYSQKAIVGQLHFCRFLFQLSKILKNVKPLTEQIGSIEFQIQNRIRETMETLITIAKNETNILKSPGFSNYIKSNSWQSLRQIIYQYDMKYREHLNANVFQRNSLKMYNNNSQLTQTIRELCNTKNIKVAELLTYYYQIKEQCNRVPAHELNDRVRFEFLVDECKDFSSLNQYYQHKINQQIQNKQRFLNKLVILGI